MTALATTVCNRQGHYRIDIRIAGESNVMHVCDRCIDAARLRIASLNLKEAFQETKIGPGGKTGPCGCGVDAEATP